MNTLAVLRKANQYTEQSLAGSGAIKGDPGKDGITPHIDPTTKHWFIGTTDTGIVAEGRNGTDGLQGIKGDKGDKGDKGEQGIQGEQGVKGDKGDTGEQGIQGEQGIAGQDGKDGTTYTPTIGTTTSLSSTQNPTASAAVNETDKTVAFNFGIPKGKDGSDGFTPTITENTSNKDD